ncbi:PEGA domain-containing protein [Thiospirochaeta perfilievii]|uniref:PEGA domain-containing protein n=1 Tax=Thiospirochaeta perfilievii TaxID=252967 RepID=A0A5C1QC46_9SPIO|nr:PEGA domain-containing protein [Thiospirochaeta perfilievii]QEN04670.1 PEGA domain-containing protein [Thiospirochaeta perfilievii]
MLKKSFLICLIFITAVFGFSQTRNSKRQYTLTVNSNVRNYEVFIDGVKQRSNKTTLPEGSHLLVVKSDGYEDYSNRINLNRNMEINAGLKPAVSNYTVTINSNVKPFDVYIDGNRISGNRIALRPGNYRIRVASRGYLDYNTNISLNKNIVINAALQPEIPKYSLIINSNIQPFNTYIDGNQISGNRIVLNAGNHSVIIKAEGYKDYITNINLNRNTELNASLEPIIPSYTITINSNITPSNIFIDGNQINGNSVVIQAGTHSILIRANGFIDYITNINLTRNTVINANLEPIKPPNAKISVVVPSDLLSKTNNSSLNQIKIYDNGKLLKGFNFELEPGLHTIRFESGGLAVESNYNFLPGKDYTIEPVFYININ